MDDEGRAVRAVFAARFNERAIQRPPRARPYVRPTDEQILALPETMRPMAFLARNVHDAAARMAWPPFGLLRRSADPLG